MRAVLDIRAGENHRMVIGGHLRDFAPGAYAIKRRSQLPTRMVLVIVQRAVVLCKRTSQAMHVKALAATTLNGEATRSIAGRDAIGTGMMYPRATHLLGLFPPLAVRRALAPEGLASAVTQVQQSQ
jgi:hypothetical protein